MKKLIVAAALVASSSLPAAAQSWTGTYGGASGGFGTGHSNQTDPGSITLPADIIPLDGQYSVKGGLLGGTLGYDLQKGPLVYGLEGDLSWANLTGQSAVCGPNTATPHPCGTELNALGTFRGRVGYATGPTGNWLVYATGGLAIGKVHGWDALTPSSGNDWRAGWTAGGGIETALARNWTAKLEYLYDNLGNAPTFNSLPGVPESVSLTANIVRLGLNYRFGGPLTAAPQMYTKALPTKAPVMALGPWFGWYAGVNAGYVDGARTLNTSAAIIANSSTPGTAPAMAAGATRQLSTGNGGFLGGGQFGYNAMLTPTVLAGVEADLQGASLHDSTTSTSTTPIAGAGGLSFVTPITVSRSLAYLGTIRGRVGVTLTPAALLYVTGGLAYGSVKSTTTIAQTGSAGSAVPAMGTVGSFSDVRAGYTIGGGAEWMFASKWSVKAEYLYYDLGSANYGTGGFGFNETFTNIGGVGVAGIATSTRVRFNGNIARLGVNYHLN